MIGFGKKASSRRFIIVCWIAVLISVAIFMNKTEWITLLTLLAGGLTSYIGIATFFKEKNYPQGGNNG